jgi:RHS repeat-associated protein
MPRLRVSFTERRRARLARKFDRIERLETRNTVTEPISVTGLSVSALRGLAQLGIAQVHGGGDALERLAAASRAAQQRGVKNAVTGIQAPGQVSTYLEIGAGFRPSADSAAAGGWRSSVPTPAPKPVASTAQQAGDWLDLSPAAPEESGETGISTPWAPAKRSGGGAALPPRGGSFPATQAAVNAMVRAQTNHGQTAAQPSAPPTIPGVYLPSPPTSGPAAGSANPVVTRNAAAQKLAQSAPLPTANPSKVVPSSSGIPVTIAENPSSLPSSTAGNGSLAAMNSFPYYPLYTLDYIDGTVFFPNTYQLATLGGSVDLRAQTSGITGVTYSWNTSNLSPVNSITGTGTYDLQFKWNTNNYTGPSVASVTLTATNASSQQESQTYYFLVPNGGPAAGGAPTWPQSLSPDTISPGSPSWASDDVSVTADSGALDTTIPLPSYNPNVPALALTYDSLTANPLPIIVVEHPLDPTQAVPSQVSAQLTFNGTAGTTWYYNTSQFTPGDIEQIALQANATSLSTGRYSYSAQVIDIRSGTTTFTYSGSATVINNSTSPFGDGWTLQGLEQIVPASGGVILSLRDGGESLWYTGSFGSGGGTYTSPAGDFSTLVLNSNGTYTRTLPDGTQINFNSSGYEIATIDLNGLHTTYSYNGSNQLTSVEDPYAGFTTFTYSSGYLQTIQDPAGRLTTFTFSGSSLQAVQQADSSRVTFTYDSSGRLTQYEDARSNVVTVVYDSTERVSTISRPDGTNQTFVSDQEQGWTNSGTSGSPATATLLAASASTYTDPNGNTTAMRPDWLGLGVVGQTTDALGDVVTNDLNSNGLATVTIDGLNRISQFTYDSLGNPVTITYPDLTTDHYTYNSDSEPLTYTDGNGHTTSYTYDSHGNLTGVKDPLNNLTTMTYTSTGRVQTETDADDYTTTYQYDSQDRLTTVLFPDGTSNLYAYNSQGNATKVTDGRGNATTYSFDALNRETGMTDALGDVATYTYDADGNLTEDQEPTPAGQTARTITYAYDSLSRLTTVTNALGYQTIYGYDSAGNPVSVKDPLGRITTTIYDALNRPTVVIDPMGNRVTTTYDADGEKLTVTDALNRTTTYTHSVRGWVSTVTDPLGNVVTYTYSPTGKELGQYQKQGSWLDTQLNYYDADDRLATFTDALGNSTIYHYDGVGNQTSVTDPNGNMPTYVYDSRNRLIEVVEPLSVTVSYTYDGSGNQQTVTDALGHTTTTLYDALDRATTIISAVGGTTTIAYDAASREISLTDPVGNKTQRAYDAADRLTTLTEPNGSTVTYVYDADNELTDTTDEDGRRTTYSYNADGDQTGETWVGASPSEKVTYTYDADNELTGAADSFATLTFTYDNDGRLATAATSGPGTGQPTVTLTYSHNQLGDETSVTDSLSSQGVTSYTYDEDQRLTLVTTTYGGTAGPQISFGYDNGSRLTSVSRQIGSSSTATQVNTTIAYDAANRVVTMTDGAATYNSFPPGWSTTPLATYVYSYDNANRVTTQVNSDGTYTYTYDNANELTGVDKNGTQVESYSYDLNGNRNSTGYTTSTGNELTASPGYTYTYDNAGNMISSTNTSTHVTTTYTYDYRNRLTEVTTGGTIVATYTYDALNRRIGTDDNGTQTWTVYDGKSPDANPYADFNGSGNLTVRYLFGPTVVNGAVMSGILARTSSGGTTAWYLTDKLGSVRDVVSSSGSELDHIVYDSFGNIVTETNASNGDRFKFAGMQYDAATGQYYDHARWYGATDGRFSGQDPAAFQAGDTNLFRYVLNGPTLGTDPSGMNLFAINPVVGGAVALAMVSLLVLYSVEYQMALGLSRQLDLQIQMAQAMRAMREAMAAQMAPGVSIFVKTYSEMRAAMIQFSAAMAAQMAAGFMLSEGNGDVPPPPTPTIEQLLEQLEEAREQEDLERLHELVEKIRRITGNRPPPDPSPN